MSTHNNNNNNNNRLLRRGELAGSDERNPPTGRRYLRCRRVSDYSVVGAVATLLPTAEPTLPPPAVFVEPSLRNEAGRRSVVSVERNHPINGTNSLRCSRRPEVGDSDASLVVLRVTTWVILVIIKVYRRSSRSRHPPQRMTSYRGVPHHCGPRC